MQFLLKFFSVTTALAGFAGAALGQNLLVNGSFENTSTFVPNSEQVMSLQQGSTALLGWTVTDAEIAWAKDTNPYVPGAADGHYFLDLTGYHDRFPFGGIVQEISTVSGETYTLSFALGVHQGNPLYRGPIEVAAIAGPVSRSFTFNPPATGVSWQKFSLSFVAQSTNTTIQFIGKGGGGNNQYFGLDDISVQLGPDLTIERTLSGAVISWPSSASNFTLEETPDLVNSVWQPVTTPAITSGDRFAVTVLLSDQKRFFRLVRRI